MRLGIFVLNPYPDLTTPACYNNENRSLREEGGKGPSVAHFTALEIRKDKNIVNVIAFAVYVTSTLEEYIY
jgi:hypothetical protein